jgi:hypothetical protein
VPAAAEAMQGSRAGKPGVFRGAGVVLGLHISWLWSWQCLGIMAATAPFLPPSPATKRSSLPLCSLAVVLETAKPDPRFPATNQSKVGRIRWDKAEGATGGGGAGSDKGCCLLFLPLSSASMLPTDLCSTFVS